MNRKVEICHWNPNEAWVLKNLWWCSTSFERNGLVSKFCRNFTGFCCWLCRQSDGNWKRTCSELHFFLNHSNIPYPLSVSFSLSHYLSCLCASTHTHMHARTHVRSPMCWRSRLRFVCEYVLRSVGVAPRLLFPESVGFSATSTTDSKFLPKTEKLLISRVLNLILIQKQVKLGWAMLIVGQATQLGGGLTILSFLTL